MLVLVSFAFIAGVVSILAPCTLPVVPLVMGAGAGGGSRRPVGIVVGLAISFVAVTIILASILAALGISTAGLRVVAVIALGSIGLTLAWPWFARRVDATFRPVAQLGVRLAGGQSRNGFRSGVAMGAAIGLVWAPCVGPIMAGTIAVAATRGPSLETALVALAYVAGAALPLLAVARLGRRFVDRVGGLAADMKPRRALGSLTVVAALLIATGLDARVQSAVTAVLPAEWSAVLYSVERQPIIQQEVRALDKSAPTASGPADVSLGQYGQAPEFEGITAWINTEPLTISGLRGRVVLVHFWTFGCINCQNVQPYVKAWYGRYAAQGFEVIGVHTPELSFEKDIANVREAVIDKGVTFPVAFDPNFRTWNAYANSYWPAMYFIDKAGRIRYAHVGEGAYAEQEQVIRQLLAE
ncbi:MAG: cytochrome c biogenesis protein/redoxin [Candidatus Limnocylindrales bacterium]